VSAPQCAEIEIPKFRTVTHFLEQRVQPSLWTWVTVPSFVYPPDLATMTLCWQHRGMNALSKRLAQTFDAARALTADQQDLLAVEMLDRVHALTQPPLSLSARERAELEAELAAARRGELASDDEVAAVYAKHGL
jgi:hypothetical protein